MRLNVISFERSSVTMLYGCQQLVATAGSKYRPVLQTRDRDPLHQYQIKRQSDGKPYERIPTQTPFSGLSQGWKRIYTRAASRHRNLSINTTSYNQKRTFAEGHERSRKCLATYEYKHWTTTRTAEVRAPGFSHLSPACHAVRSG